MPKTFTFLLQIFLLAMSFLSVAQPTSFEKVIFQSPSDLHSDFILSQKDNGLLDFGSRYIDNFIMKIDSAGSIVWSKQYTFGNVPNSKFIDAVNLHDSSFAAVGATDNTGFCVKFKKNGDTLWCRKISHSNYERIIPYSICSTSDSGFVICGYNQLPSSTSGPLKHAFVAKFTKSGVISWMKTLYTSYYGSFATTVKQTPDSGFVFIGSIQNSSAVDGCILVAKLDKGGNLVWNTKYCESISQNYNSYGMDISIENDGYLCLVSTNSYQNALLRTDTAGTITWAKKYTSSGYIGGGEERSLVLRKISAGRFLLITKSTDGANGEVLVTDSAGTVLWSKGTFMTGIDIIENKNTSFSLIGNPSGIVVKTRVSVSGRLGFVRSDTLNPPLLGCNYNNNVTSSTLTYSTSVLNSSLNIGGVAASISPTLSIISFSTVNGCLPIPSGISKNNYINASVYPNPSSGKITIQSESFSGKEIRFEIQNLLGIKLFTKEVRSTTNSIEIDISELPASVYMYYVYEKTTPLNSGKLIIED